MTYIAQLLALGIDVYIPLLATLSIFTILMHSLFMHENN